MNIKLTPVTAYKIEIDGNPIPGEFSIDGPVWHGLTCLKGPGGAQIIAGIQDAPLDKVFREFMGDKSLTGQVVSLSPALEKILSGEAKP